MNVIYVCYFDFGYEKSNPKFVTNDEDTAKRWCGNNGYDAEYVDLTWNEELGGWEY